MSAPVSAMPLWGQAWKLVVTSATPTGAKTTTIESKAWQPEPLRITFEVMQARTQQLWFADISIYNLENGADQQAQDVVLNATWAQLSAGFQFGPSVSAVIWDGPVFQVLFTLEGVVDQKITLHCVDNPLLFDEIISFAMGPFGSQQQLVSRMVAAANLPPVNVAQGTQGQVASQRMSATQYPRGNTVFGKVSKYLQQVSDSNFLQTWNNGKQAYISEADSGNRTPDLIYAPAFPPGGTQDAAADNQPPGTTNSIIGTPQQIQQGVVFTVLLDPRLAVGLPPLLVQLVRTQIAQLQQSPGTGFPTALTNNLTFFPNQVRHVGDTRGNDWYTEVVGWSPAYAQTLLSLF